MPSLDHVDYELWCVEGTLAYPQTCPSTCVVEHVLEKPGCKPWLYCLFKPFVKQKTIYHPLYHIDFGAIYIYIYNMHASPPGIVFIQLAYCPEVWRFIELFAGEAMVSAELRLSSYAGVSLDVIYGGGAMDLLSPAGMAFLSPVWKGCFPHRNIFIFVGVQSYFSSMLGPPECRNQPCIANQTSIVPTEQGFKNNSWSNSIFLTMECKKKTRGQEQGQRRVWNYRLALLAVLKLEPDALGILAPVCSSMGFLVSSVTSRNFMLPLGDTSKLTVSQGNLLACRYLDENFQFLYCPQQGIPLKKRWCLYLSQSIQKVHSHMLGPGCPWPLLFIGAAKWVALPFVSPLAVLLQIHLQSHLVDLFQISFPLYV